MMFGRTLKTSTEKKFWEEAYKIGMKNGWCSGQYAMADGDFITEDDRLNKESVCVIDDIEKLREFFIHGNWCLGQAVIYKSICFINQINGGDEWLTMKRFKDGEVIDFESITFRPMCHEYKEVEGEWYHRSVSAKDKCSKDGHFVDYINRLLKAKRRESNVTPGKMVVDY